MVNKTYISWNEYYNNIITMASQIKNYIKVNKLNIEYLYGVPRGGQTLANLLSYQLNIAPISFNDLKVVNKDNVLVIEDIIDTGNTIQVFLDSGYKVFSMFLNTNKTKYSSGISYLKGITNSDWICFPYEYTTEVKHIDFDDKLSNVNEYNIEKSRREK